jgi:hypothetical protein
MKNASRILGMRNEADLIARQHENRIYRQATQFVVRRRGDGHARKGEYAANRNSECVPRLDVAPDSRRIAYSKFLDNRLTAIFLYSLESKNVNQLTDGLADARYQVFAVEIQALRRQSNIAARRKKQELPAFIAKS